MECRAEDSWNKPKPFDNRMDRGGNMAPPRKRADFQQVERHESVGRTFLWRKSQMNVDLSMCASSDLIQHWDQIDWNRCRRQVKRLQARIVKATRERRWGKVKILQRLLTHSFSGKALAVNE